MRVKITEDLGYIDIAAGTEFDVKFTDDGFYTNNPFYGGWIKCRDGRKIYYAVDKKYCEVVDWD